MSTYREQNYPSAPFPTSRSARTLALLMNQQQKTEIGERIRELRKNSAETNRTIADYVGVSPDAVKAWIAGRGISYDSAQKVAELFEVDVDYIWRGREKATPDPFSTDTVLSADDSERLRKIEQDVAEILERLRRQDGRDEGEGGAPIPKTPPPLPKAPPSTPAEDAPRRRQAKRQNGT